MSLQMILAIAGGIALASSFFMGRNATWGGATFGVVIGVIVGLVIGNVLTGVIWGFAIGALTGVVAELLPRVFNLFVPAPSDDDSP